MSGFELDQEETLVQQNTLAQQENRQKWPV